MVIVVKLVEKIKDIVRKHWWIAALGKVCVMAFLLWKAHTMRGDVAHVTMSRQEFLYDNIARYVVEDEPKGCYAVNFFASWCTFCMKEHDFLMKISKKGLNMYGVALWDSEESVTKTLSSIGDPYVKIQYRFPEEYLDSMGISGIPYTVVILDSKVIYVTDDLIHSAAQEKFMSVIGDRCSKK